MSFDPRCIRFSSHPYRALGQTFEGVRCDIAIGPGFAGLGEDEAEALARAAGEWSRHTRAARLRAETEARG